MVFCIEMHTAQVRSDSHTVYSRACQSRKHMSLCNISTVPVAYHWDIQQPISDEETTDSINDANRDVVFQVEPSEGVLDAMSAEEFCFSFVPHRLGEQQALAQFVVEAVPESTIARMHRVQQVCVCTRLEIDVGFDQDEIICCFDFCRSLQSERASSYP